MAAAGLEFTPRPSGLGQALTNILPTPLDPYAELMANAALALVTLLVGLWIAGFASNIVRMRSLRSPRIDDTLGNFFASIVRYLIIAFVVIAVLQRFGVEATSLVAVLGAATLAIGLALQGTLGNVASGVMLIFFRPYKLGDFVELDGHEGTVKDLNIFTTELATVDNVKVIIPNGAAWAGSVVNYSGHPERRIDTTVGISYDDDMDKAMGLMSAIADADPRILNSPEAPWVRVVELNESSVDLQLRVWVAGKDYWDVKFELLKAIKMSFDTNNIEIPYPHAVEIEKPYTPRKT